MKNFFENKLNKGNPFVNQNNNKEDGVEVMADETIKENENEQIVEENNDDTIVEEKEQEIASENTEETKTEEKVEECSDEDETAKLKLALDTLNNQYIRLAADFDNYRKRQAQERESLLKYGTEQCLKKMIEVVDNFERATKAVEKLDDVEKMKESFAVLNKQFIDSLTKMGLQEIKCVGEKFDPNLHEAVMQTPTEEYEEETIINELQKGYKYDDKVIRPSMVNVAVK